MMGETTSIDRLIEKNRLKHAELAKHPKSKIKAPSKDAWIDAYFARSSLRVAYHRSRIPLIGSRSQIKKQDLEVPLKMFLQEAAFYADDWTDVHRKYGDRRSFSMFLELLEPSGLEKYAEDNGLGNGYMAIRKDFVLSLDDVVITDK